MQQCWSRLGIVVLLYATFSLHAIAGELQGPVPPRCDTREVLAILRALEPMLHETYESVQSIPTVHRSPGDQARRLAEKLDQQAIVYARYLSILERCGKVKEP